MDAQSKFGEEEKKVMQKLANNLLVSSDNWSNYSDDPNNKAAVNVLVSMSVTDAMLDVIN
mgnify:CR=1 FL=1